MAGSVVVAVGGDVADPGHYAVNTTTGIVTFTVEHIPASERGEPGGQE